MSSSPCRLDPIVIPLIKGNKILDVACGYGRWGCLLKFNYWEFDNDQPPVVDGIDGFPPNIDYCKKLGVYRDLQVKMLPCDLGHREYDTVLACEIVEHLQESQVSSFFESIEKAAIKRVIITTPNFLYLRPGHNTMTGFNRLEAHKCYISREYLQKRDYKIFGSGFTLKNHLRMMRITQLLKSIGLNVRYPGEVLKGFAYYFPSFGQDLIAYKDITES